MHCMGSGCLRSPNGRATSAFSPRNSLGSGLFQSFEEGVSDFQP